MSNCNECKIINSLNNAWRALNAQYDNEPDEETRRAINMLAKMIRKIESDFLENKKALERPQITIDEWLEWLNT